MGSSQRECWIGSVHVTGVTGHVAARGHASVVYGMSGASCASGCHSARVIGAFAWRDEQKGPLGILGLS